MWGAIVAAIAALGGVALGKLLDVRSEARRWRREQKTEAYASLAGAARAYLAGAQGAEDLTYWATSAAAVALDTAHGAVKIVGSKAVGDAQTS
jgi:hypothetical protein